MATLAEMATSLFDRSTVFTGSLTLRIYGPISGWTLPAGVTYNSLTDTFLDSDGDPVSVSYSGQPYTAVAYVPGGTGGNLVEVSIPGVTETEGHVVTVKRTSAVASALDTAWAVEAPAGSGTLYRITNRREIPEGNPTLIRLELTERG